MERLRHVVVGAEAETTHLVVDARQTRQYENRRSDLGDAERLQDLITAHIGKIQIEQNNIVIIKFTEIDALFPKVRRINIKSFRLQHKLDALRRGTIILNE